MRNLKVKIIILILSLFTSCILCLFFKNQVLDLVFMRAIYGPLTLQEVIKVARLPVHRVDNQSQYKNLNEIYYFFDYQPELTLATYFTMNDQIGSPTRVAKMLTHNVWGGPGPYDTTSQEITIIWASSKIGHGCKSFADGARGDRILGEVYQSCFYWFDEHNQYILYTIWTEEETEEFVNSLIRVK